MIFGVLFIHAIRTILYAIVYSKLPITMERREFFMVRYYALEPFTDKKIYNTTIVVDPLMITLFAIIYILNEGTY